jgi:hypothetical protein
MLGNDQLIWKKFIVSFQNIFWVKFKLNDRSLGILFNIACCWFYVILLSYIQDSLYIPLVSILTTSPYISQRVHFPVLNFVTYNFMYVFCLLLFPAFCRIHVYNSLIIRCRKSISQRLQTSLFRLSDQLRTSFFTVTHITPVCFNGWFLHLAIILWKSFFVF